MHQLNFRVPKEVFLAATEAARQQCQSLSAILRRHLEAYAASQPLKQANKPE